MKKLLFLMLSICCLNASSQDDAKAKKEALKQYLRVPVGAILTYAGDEASFNRFLNGRFMICKGQKLNKNNYPVLYYVIGSIWGSDNSDDFYIPDLSGRFLRGADPNGTRDPNIDNRFDITGKAVSGVGGYQEDAFQGHSHLLGNGTSDKQANSQTGSRFADWIVGSGKNQTTGIVTNEAFGEASVSKETRPKNASVLFIIRVK